MQVLISNCTLCLFGIICRIATVRLVTVFGTCLKYEYELNCQENSKFYKFISKRRIIFFMYSSILRQIWLNFMATCLFFSVVLHFSQFFPLFYSFHIFFPGFSNFLDLSITEEALVKMRIWSIKIDTCILFYISNVASIYRV
jgi:hypothetical protein